MWCKRSITKINLCTLSHKITLGNFNQPVTEIYVNCAFLRFSAEFEHCQWNTYIKFQNKWKFLKCRPQNDKYKNYSKYIVVNRFYIYIERNITNKANSHKSCNFVKKRMKQCGSKKAWRLWCDFMSFISYLRMCEEKPKKKLGEITWLIAAMDCAMVCI